MHFVSLFSFFFNFFVFFFCFQTDEFLWFRNQIMRFNGRWWIFDHVDKNNCNKFYTCCFNFLSHLILLSFLVFFNYLIYRGFYLTFKHDFLSFCAKIVLGILFYSFLVNKTLSVHRFFVQNVKILDSCINPKCHQPKFTFFREERKK